MGNIQEKLEKARAYAFLLLKFRLRSERELSQRLKRKQFDQKTIAKTITFLKEKKFIDDKLFAQEWVNSRIKRPLGLRRLRQELKLKGISEDIIEYQLNKIKKDYPEKEIVSEIARTKLKKLTGIDPEKAKRRTFAYLFRRGFSPEIITESLR